MCIFIIPEIVAWGQAGLLGSLAGLASSQSNKTMRGPVYKNKVNEG